MMRPFEIERTPWDILAVMVGAIIFAVAFAFLGAVIEAMWIVDRCEKSGSVQTVGAKLVCRVTS